MDVLETQTLPVPDGVTVETLVDSTIVANDKLAQMLTELDALRLENAELKGRLDRIMAAVDRVRERQHRLSTLKQQAKDAKTAHDGAVVDMLDAASEEELPLFDRKQTPPAAATGNAAPAEPVTEPEPKLDESWRELSVTTLELPVKLTEALLEQKPKPMETLGDLADFLAKNWMTDLQGVGPAKAKIIEDAWAKFWTDHPQFCEGYEPEDTSGSEGTESTASDNTELSDPEAEPMGIVPEEDEPTEDEDGDA